MKDKNNAMNALASAAVMCAALDEVVLNLMKEMDDDGIGPSDSINVIKIASVTLMLFISARLEIDFEKMASSVSQSIKDGSAQKALDQIDDFVEQMNNETCKDLH